ncbi:MAG: AraC family transcriptional regulator [Pyrinomonadaceae bacterium]|nr:AraC family transcriptional regulator [Pyrinomonadaceae bacterium]
MQANNKKLYSQKEETKVWHSNEFGHLECLKANYVTHSFAPHTHEGFAIGVVERGIEVFNLRGNRYQAGKDQIILINPGEVHDGNGLNNEGWAFSIFYADPKVLNRALAESSEGRQKETFFKEPVVNDPLLAGKLLQLHRTLENSNSFLEKEILILETFAQLTSRQGEKTIEPKEVLPEPKVVSRVKSYIEENYLDNITLAEISAFAYMSQFHLIRVFKKHTGLSPYAYLEQIRINRAKELLLKGESIIQTAYELGFTDQSHFTKTFKRFTGTTPGLYQNQ